MDNVQNFVNLTQTAIEAETAATQPTPGPDTSPARGRPRFDDPSDPAQIWAIANQKIAVGGKIVSRAIYANILGSWVKMGKSAMKATLQGLPKDRPVDARLDESGNLLLGG